jgi:hypothetical protein
MEVWQAIAATVTIGVSLVGIGMWIGAVNSDRDSFKTFMARIETKVDDILKRLPPVTVAGSSPLRLTDLGQTISEQIGGKELARTLAPTLLEKIKGMEPYEIQEECRRYVTEDFAPTEEQERIFKACAFENGIKVEQIWNVVAVELRDELLSLR